jgi:hypothetical protein
MNSPTESSVDPIPDGAPYLPPSLPTLPTVVPGQPQAPTLADPGDGPVLPAARPVAPTTPRAPVFDAKAMVASQKRGVSNPVYGGIPQATPENLEAARALRAEAQRKRKRNKTMGWTIALGALAVVGSAGWFGYQAYQDDQDQLTADRAARATAGENSIGTAPGALTPLGNQEQVVELLDDVSSGGATASAGGLLDIVDQAQAAVDDVNGNSGADDPEVAAALMLDDLLPAPVVRLGTRLDDLDGYERYVVDARLFAADDATGYARFLAIVQAQPQSDPVSADAGVVPPIQAGEIGFAIQHDGDRVVRALIVSSDPAVHLDYSPG